MKIQSWSEHFSPEFLVRATIPAGMVVADTSLAGDAPSHEQPVHVLLTRHREFVAQDDAFLLGGVLNIYVFRRNDPSYFFLLGTFWSDLASDQFFGEDFCNTETMS